MTLFQDKYRVESTRLEGWDYSSAGLYFVTICTRSRECFFGDIVDGEMRLSRIGEIVADEWQKTPAIRDNIDLDEWIVMPNHLHGIIVIHGDAESGKIVETPRRGVSTKPDGPLPPRLKSNSLGSIVGQFKSVCTKRIWALGYADFGWQARFYDHIIRNERALERIRNYIIGNPAKWNADRNNPTGLRM